MSHSIVARVAAAIVSAVRAVIAGSSRIATNPDASAPVAPPGGGQAVNRRQVFLSTAKAGLASAIGGSWLGLRATAAEAQVAKAPQINAGPPKVSALPYPDPAFKGVIGRTTEDSQADFPQPVSAPAGAPSRGACSS